MREDQIFRIRAKKEIILSGGAVNSPQILMLSGVGPQEHLTQLGNWLTLLVSFMHLKM